MVQLPEIWSGPGLAGAEYFSSGLRRKEPSLIEFLDFKHIFGQTIVVVNEKCRLFYHPALEVRTGPMFGLWVQDSDNTWRLARSTHGS